jgi:hypothetical protein
MADSLLLSAALSYASLGLRIIPLHHVLPDGTCSCGRCTSGSKHKGKHPREENWPRRASTAPENIRSWWRCWPDANVGIATGRGIMVLDVDGDEGRDSLILLQRRHAPLPETALAATGGGGLHYFFRTPAPIRSATSANKVWPGLDVLGENSLVVAAPSLHHSGGRYRWVRHPDQGVAPIPNWLLTQLQRAGRVKGYGRDGPSEPILCVPICAGGRRASETSKTPPESKETPPDPQLVNKLLEEMVQRFPVTQFGERNGQMYPAVASLICRGCSPELTTAVMAAWLAHHRRNMRAEPEEALRLLNACVRCALGSDALRPARSADEHESLCTGILLTPLQRSFLNAVIVAGELPSADYVFRLPSHGRRQSLLLPLPCDPLLLVRGKGGAGGKGSGRWLCANAQERAFVEAVIVHCLHKLLQTEEGVIKATNDQLRGIMRARHGLEPHPQQFARLKHTFITRPGKPAKRFELMRETAQGRRTAHGGIPSEYELTGLGWLFSREEGCEADWAGGQDDDPVENLLADAPSTLATTGPA